MLVGKSVLLRLYNTARTVGVKNTPVLWLSWSRSEWDAEMKPLLLPVTTRDGQARTALLARAANAENSLAAVRLVHTIRGSVKPWLSSQTATCVT
jgi:hypothetical protein